MSQSALIDLSGTSVLCIEDDPVIRSVVRQAFQRHGCHDVVVAHGGEEALDLCAGRRFDLLICGYDMSPMNGLEFLRELAGTGLNETWPVIMLRGDIDPATIQEAQDLGVRAWLDKPISLQALLANVGSVLHLGCAGPGAQAAEVIEQHHARLMVALRMAEEANQCLRLRPREAVTLLQSLRQAFAGANQHASSLGYDLIPMLSARGNDLAVALAQRSAADHSAVPVLGTLITAMKRVAENRMMGDGGAAGRKLLQTIDGLTAPVRASLGQERRSRLRDGREG